MNTIPRKFAALLAALCLFAVPAAAQSYTAGTYEAAVQGMIAPVKVSVTLTENAIENVSVLEHSETEGIGTLAVERLPEKIVSTQSLGIDVVTGATVTSNAIIDAVADCINQAGGDAEALKAVPVEEKTAEKIEYETDVVIVGGGCAGLGAALTAADNGEENVILLETTGRLGGKAYISGGIIQGVNSRAHIERGLTDDTADAWYEYWNNMSEGHQNATLVRKVIDMSGDTCNWIEDMGVVYDAKLLPQGETTVPRSLTAANKAGGKGLIQPMIDKLNETGVTVLMETTGESILQDENGHVYGVTAVDNQTGTQITIRAKKVIMAAGGFEVEQIRAIGAQFVYRSSEPDGTIFGQDGLYVNERGERFTNESGYYARIFQNLYDTGIENCYAYMIVNEKMVDANEKLYHQADGSAQTWRTLIENSKIDGFTYSGLDGGETFEGATLEEALTAAGIPVETAKNTIARYNELCDKGVDEDFGKSAEYMVRIDENGPFYVWRVPRSSMNMGDTVGGPAVDDYCHVLDESGAPIENLYAVGYTINTNFQWRMYVGSGSYIQYCITTGRIAGEEAAKLAAAQ